MRQYPHYAVWFNTIQPAPYVDDNGNMVYPTATKTEVRADCRMENPGQSGEGTKTVATQQGTEKVYSITVYMPLKEPTVTEGTEMKIYHKESNLLLGYGDVKRPFKGMLNITVWI